MRSPPACSRSASSPGDRIGIWSPNNAEWVLTQFATAKAGLILVNINPAYRLAELEYALNKSGCMALDHRGAVQDQRLSRHAARAGAGARPTPRPAICSAAKLPELRLVITDRRRGRARHDGVRRPRRRLAATSERAAARGSRRDPAVRRPDQHPVHQRHDRAPQGRDADPPQHPQQRLLHRPRRCGSPRPTGCASRCRSITASAWCSATSPA